MPKEIHESTAISIPEVRELLLARGREGELSYMQRLALEHAQLVTRINSKNAKTLIATLEEKFQISHNGAITLANYIPDNVHEIRQLLGKEAMTKETETLEEILNTLNGVEKIDKKELVDLDDLDNELDADFDQEEKVIDESMIPDDI